MKTPTEQQEIILTGAQRFFVTERIVKLEPTLPSTGAAIDSHIYRLINEHGKMVGEAAVDPEDDKPVFKPL